MKEDINRRRNYRYSILLPFDKIMDDLKIGKLPTQNQ